MKRGRVMYEKGIGGVDDVGKREDGNRRGRASVWNGEWKCFSGTMRDGV